MRYSVHVLLLKIYRTPYILFHILNNKISVEEWITKRRLTLGTVYSENVDFGVVGRFFLVFGQCAFFCIIAQLLSSEVRNSIFTEIKKSIPCSHLKGRISGWSNVPLGLVRKSVIGWSSSGYHGYGSITEGSQAIGLRNDWYEYDHFGEGTQIFRFGACYRLMLFVTDPQSYVFNVFFAEQH